MSERERFEEWLDECPVAWQRKWGEDTFYFDINDETEEVDDV